MNVVLKLMEVAVEFVWWGGGGVCIVLPNYSSVGVVLHCIVVGAVTI